MDGDALLAAFKTFQRSVYWHNANWNGPTDRTHLAGYADANPNEAGRVADWVKAVAAGAQTSIPDVATKQGQGIVGMLRAAAGQAPGIIAAVEPVYSGVLTVTTKNDGETVEIHVDGNLCASIAPAASYNLDTRDLPNGAHTVWFRYLRDGVEVSRSDVATVQVRN